MAYLAANLSMMFNEVPFLSRFERAAAQGFAGVEFLFPYAFAAEDIAAELARLDLTQALFNLAPGDWNAGERGLAALPGRERDFRASVDQALRYAERLNCTRLHVMAGIVAREAEREAMRQTYLNNLGYAASRFADFGITLLLEPINDRDMPGYLLNHQDEGHAVVAALARPNVKVQMDFYHAQIMDGDLWRRWQRGRDQIGHIQIAGVPERHEPDSGEVHYAWLFEQLDAAGYAGWIGCEYVPRGDTVAGLAWAAPWLSSARS